jgi:hypothetical protein
VDYCNLSTYDRCSVNLAASSEVPRWIQVRASRRSVALALIGLALRVG